MLGSEVVALISGLGSLANAVVAWLATYAVHSTALILIALAVTARRAPWRISTATRDIVWKAAIVGGVVTSSVQLAANASPLGGIWKLGGDPPRGATQVRVVVTSGQVDHLPDFAKAPPPPPLGPSDHLPATLVLPPLSLAGKEQFAFIGGLTLKSLYIAGLALLWLAGVLVMLSRYDNARSHLDRMLANRVPADDGVAGRVLKEAMRRAGVDRRMRLTASDRLESPAVLSSEEICVPRRFLREVNIFEQETIFAHEIGHVVRRDGFWLWIANLVVYVFFFQPLNRLARTRLIEVAEFSADELAVRTTGQPLHLARALAAVASWLSPATRLTMVPAMASAKGSVLVRRVMQLTAGQGPQTPSSRRSGFALAFFTLLSASVVVPRIDLSSPFRGDVVRQMVFQQRVDSTAGDPATGLRVLDVDMTIDSTGAPGQVRSRTLILRRVGHDSLAATGKVFAPRWISVRRRSVSASSD